MLNLNGPVQGIIICFYITVLSSAWEGSMSWLIGKDNEGKDNGIFWDSYAWQHWSVKGQPTGYWPTLCRGHCHFRIQMWDQMLECYLTFKERNSCTQKCQEKSCTMRPFLNVVAFYWAGCFWDGGECNLSPEFEAGQPQEGYFTCILQSFGLAQTAPLWNPRLYLWVSWGLPSILCS